MTDKRFKHGLHGTPLYNKWHAMHGRCYNPSASGFDRYGGRGISVCERWHDLANFVADMGPTYSTGMELDRVDNEKNYEPSNCRWATRLEQANNKRSVRLIAYQGESLSLAQWAVKTGISYGTLRERIQTLGWSLERAFSAPPLSADDRCLLARKARYSVTP